MKKIIFMICLPVLLTAGGDKLFCEEISKKLTISSFLKTVEQDDTLKNQRELNIYLDKAPESTPYLDRVEIRGKTEEFDLEKQKYSLRFYPKGWGETKYSRLVNETLKSSGRTDYDVCLNSGLLKRYELVLEFLENRKMIAIKNKLAVVCIDRINVLKKKSSGSGLFDISDLISAEELLTSLKLELVKLKNKRTGIIHKIRLAANSETDISFNERSLITVQKIKSFLKKKPVTDTENINLKSRQDKVTLAQNKFRLEAAKSRDYLSFFQVSYDRDDADDYEKAYSIEFGIKLPFINSDREDINRKKFSYMKERLQYQEEKKLMSEKLFSLTRGLERLILQYGLLVENMKNGNARTSYNTYLKMEGVDPLNILKLKESILKSDIRRIETGFEIRRKFISLLFSSGKLFRQPFVNFLSQKMEMVK